MSIYKIAGERLTQLKNQMNSLRPGQIVQGKIVKLFPDNKAQIKLGSKTMIAQLEASLNIGEKYHFQVKSTDRIIHLSVLGARLNSKNEINAKVLLDQFGFKASKSNITLLKGLINSAVPFEKADIANALQLLDGANNKKQTIQLLQQMISHKLPVTRAVLEALSTTQASNLSSQIKIMLSAAAREGNDTSPSLIRLLEGMNTRPQNQNGTLALVIMHQAKNNNPQLFSLLQFTGVIDPDIDFSAWKSAWHTVKSGSGELPVSMKLPAAVQSLEQVNQQKAKLSASAHEIMQLWANRLSEAITRNTSMAKADFERIKQQMAQSLSLNNEQPSFINHLRNNAAEAERIFSTLKMLANTGTYTLLDQLLNQVKSENTFLQAAPKEQFLMQLKQWLAVSGMDYENSIASNRMIPEASLKGLLLQMMATGTGNVQEQAGQFLQYLNGLQLHSVHESNGFLHISLQIPGEKLGLLQDIDLEFESRKTDTGEINPEHCRILFYLHLEKLHETVVDMHIQKRAVNVTVYNDAENPGDIFGGLKNMLKTGLEDLDYQLSIVQYRKLHKMEDRDEKINPDRLSSQGVDYRI